MSKFITLTYTGITDKGNISYKTWSIAVSGSKVTTCWGKSGKTQNKKTHSLKTAAKAAAFAQKIMKEKLAKGYRLGGRAKCNPPPGMSGRHSDFASLADARQAAQAWADYTGKPRIIYTTATGLVHKATNEHTNLFWTPVETIRPSAK